MRTARSLFVLAAAASLVAGSPANAIPPIKPDGDSPSPRPFGDAPAPVEPAPAPKPAAAPVDRYKLPVGHAPTRGPEGALVTIVEYSDFQCPFCARVQATLDRIARDYGGDVRLVFKHNPLPFHVHARPAARVAVVAARQGRFWPLHDAFFAGQDTLRDEGWEPVARKAGFDVEALRRDAESPEVDAAVQADVDEAARFGARGTPCFFLNGRPLAGAQPYEAFRALLDEEIAAARRLRDTGVAPAALYETIVRDGKDRAPAPPPRPAPPPDDNVYRVPVGHSPERGPHDAQVTLVEFADYQCPFCARLEATLGELLVRHATEVRVVWKDHPLPFHEHAMDAALAARAAGEQGRFWEMHDLLFKNQSALDRASLRRYAADLGLDLARFDRAMASPKVRAAVDEDVKLAERLGSRGTPDSFVNGRNVRGAQPLAVWEKSVARALDDARAARARGVEPKDLYEALVRGGKDRVVSAAPPGDTKPPDPTVYAATIDAAPVDGKARAPVTLVEWGDYQCPFTRRAEATVHDLVARHPGEIRRVWKQLPLPFHPYARIAAEASLAAQAQGRFWPMHERLMRWFGEAHGDDPLDVDRLVDIARELRLDTGRFREDLERHTFGARIDAEIEQGNRIGARGTPSFFVNGKSLVGAQPLEVFDKLFTVERDAARARMKRQHLDGARFYALLMREGKTAPPPARNAGDPEDDTRIYPVQAGDAPSIGPADAAVTVVEFGDFQCPFTARADATMKKLLADYPRDVRLVWRHYPLPFHQNAIQAAEAAEAARAQGRFWPLHDVLLEHGAALDRASLVRYAVDLGLDADAFRRALDEGTGKARIDADLAAGNALDTGGLGTPTFFVNGRKVAGAQPYETFRRLVDSELARRKK